jgi:monovalent cation:H+ antiporter-2, CPA2 family
MNYSILESILSVFFIALVVAVLFRQLRLSVILGYLIVGAVVGPHALKLIPNHDAIKQLAEFGIVFLMFTVGLEFSLPKLFTLKKPVFLIGTLQVLLSLATTVLVGKLFGMTTITAIIVGSIVAMSSTAIVVKQLNDQGELYSPHGMNAIGILLFQDLAVIPLLILISGLAKSDHVSLANIFLWALLKGALAILIIFILGKKLLKPLFRMIAKTRAIELFTLTVLLVTLTAAWLTNRLGLSFALGAFLAGIMLAETEFRHQIEVEIRPFRDILLGLFFISIGMLTDTSSWDETWIWIALLVFAIVIGKLFIITLLTRFSGSNLAESLETGLVLAQGGEFGFALLTLALAQNSIPADYAQVVLAALLISIAISPILIRFNNKIAKWLLPKETQLSEEVIQNQIKTAARHLKNHIIISGYGRVGQHIARLLDKINLPYIGLDLDAELVQRASLAGDNVIYADSTHPEILKAAGLAHAKVLVICTDNINASKRTLIIARQKNPTIPILVRCRDENELARLKDKGATHVIAELFEESLTLSHYLMKILNIPAAKIAGVIEEVRNKDYDLLQKVFTGTLEQDKEYYDEISLTRELRPILLPESAYAVDHQLDEFNLKEINVEVVAIRRGTEKHLKPQGDTNLHAKDILILFGEISDLEKAENIILHGLP